jgi:hypothetical protein
VLCDLASKASRGESEEVMPGEIKIEIEGGVRANISVLVTADDLKGWSPERISLFFDGVAQVLKARAGEPTKQETSAPKEPEHGHRLADCQVAEA